MKWGGARAGAGRPAKGSVPSEPHKRRPSLLRAQPVHVVARMSRELRTLAKRRKYQAIDRALTLSLGRIDFRITHLALRAGRLELVVEADHTMALAKGMQGFQVSAARRLNHSAHRRGTVFLDRYRMTALVTRAALRAVIGSLARTTAWPQTIVAFAVTSALCGDARWWEPDS